MIGQPTLEFAQPQAPWLEPIELKKLGMSPFQDLLKVQESKLLKLKLNC